MLRIMFNRTYATNAHIAWLLRSNPDGRDVEVVGTHVDPHSPVLAACDEAYPEPEGIGTGPDYVDWALNFVIEHRIDVFIPRLALAALVAAQPRFAEAGVALIAAPLAAIELLADKGATYRDAADRGLPVPPHRVVRSSDALRHAVEELASSSDVLCLKPTIGIGGDGFRTLRTTGPSLADLTGPLTSDVTLQDVCAALDAAEQSDDADSLPELMVLPYLPGPEISVDVLADPLGEPVVAIGRLKSGRQRRIVDDRAARESAELLVRAHQVAYLSNTQVRYWQGPDDDQPQPYLLEVNTRMSGGLFQTSLAGVNLAWSAVRLALGQDAGISQSSPRFDISYGTLSSLNRPRRKDLG